MSVPYWLTLSLIAKKLVTNAAERDLDGDVGDEARFGHRGADCPQTHDGPLSFVEEAVTRNSSLLLLHPRLVEVDVITVARSDTVNLGRKCLQRFDGGVVEPRHLRVELLGDDLVGSLLLVVGF